jgi:hypothetical protein
MIVALAAFLLLQQQGQATPPLSTLKPSPVARIALSPSPLVVAASDSIHLTATAYDANGQKIEDAHLRFAGAAANGGHIDTTGWVIARGTGKVTGSVISLLPGVKPYVHRFEVVMVPDAPATIRIDPLPEKVVVGQRVRAMATVLTKINDRRETDAIAWSSSAPGVARIDGDGVLVAVAPGKSTITAADAPATTTTTIQVVPNTIADIELTPRKLTRAPATSCASARRRRMRQEKSSQA